MDEAAARFFLDALLSESSSSDDDFVVRGPLVLRPRVLNYIEEVVDQYTDSEFRQNFRMNRITFAHLLLLLVNKITLEVDDKGRHTISAKSQVLIFLWYFGTPDSIRSICGRFNVGKATALRTIRRVTNALFELNNIIEWPSGQYLNDVKAGFHRMGFNNTIGCIDGMHIRIPKPKDHGQSYINRKSYPSVILQGVCDHTLKFIHCYAGEVGSNHDATVLRRSEIWSYIIDIPHEKFPEDTHLLGDKAYPCLPQLIPPYKDNGHLTAAQKHFNFTLSRTRCTIERAFGLLQKRFRRLKDLLDVRCLEWAPKYIIACCKLHNICIMQNDILDVEYEGIDNEDHLPPDGMFQDVDRRQLILGREKRNRICREINVPNNERQ